MECCKLDFDFELIKYKLLLLFKFHQTEGLIFSSRNLMPPSAKALCSKNFYWILIRIVPTGKNQIALAFIRNLFHFHEIINCFSELPLIFVLASTSIPRTTDAQQSLFPIISQTFGLEQANLADKFWSIFGQIISTILAPWVSYGFIP